MTGTGTGTAGAALHEAAFQAALTLFADDDDTVVKRTPTRVKDASNVVTMGPVRSTQEAATLGPQRSRNEDLTFTLFFASFVTGDPEDVDETARDRAFDLLNRVADQFRSALSGDTTLGGQVLWCFLSNYDAERLDSRDPAGCLWEIEAEFSARYRIRG